MPRTRFLAGFVLALAAAPLALAQEEPRQDQGDPAPPAPTQPMTGARLGEIVRALDPEAAAGPNGYDFTIGARPVTLIFDDAADRMRVLTPIAPADAAPPALLERMLQANFDAVLDARYAIAQDVIWSVYIHPLSPLSDDQVLSGLAQTVTAAETFGTTFSSGALVFGGGDSTDLHERLLDQLNAADKQEI